MYNNKIFDKLGTIVTVKYDFCIVFIIKFKSKYFMKTFCYLFESNKVAFVYLFQIRSYLILLTGSKESKPFGS